MSELRARDEDNRQRNMLRLKRAAAGLAAFGMVAIAFRIRGDTPNERNYASPAVTATVPSTVQPAGSPSTTERQPRMTTPVSEIPATTVALPAPETPATPPAPTIITSPTTQPVPDCSVRSVEPGRYFNPGNSAIDDQLATLGKFRDPSEPITFGDVVNATAAVRYSYVDPRYADAMSQTVAGLEAGQPAGQANDFLAIAVEPPELCDPDSLYKADSSEQLTRTLRVGDYVLSAAGQRTAERISGTAQAALTGLRGFLEGIRQPSE